LTVLKPTKSAAGSYECKDAKMTKLCGADKNKFEHVFCIPTASDCPLTHISFTDNGVLEISSDVHYGAALVDLMMSEGGPPCMHDDSVYNSQVNPPKVQYELWPDDYYKACPSRTINGKTYTVSQMYTVVDGFKPVSEMTLVKQNKGGDLYDDYVKHFRAYKMDVMKTYKSNSYSKAYTKWHPDSCVRKTSNGTMEKVTPHIVEEILDGVCYSVLWKVYLIQWLLVILISAQIFESFMIHMYKMEALGQRTYNLIQYARRAISVVMQIIAFVCIYYIADHSNNNTLKFLAET